MRTSDPSASEFSGKLFDLWAYQHKVQIDFSRPGKPTDNCFIGTFNGSLRDECLNVNWFETIDEARIKIESSRVDYNESRPHQGLNDLVLVEYARKITSRTVDQSVIDAGNSLRAWSEKFKRFSLPVPGGPHRLLNGWHERIDGS